MSTATAGSTQSMRQQLDELDALLQRMLTLPINQLDETAPGERTAKSPATALPIPRPAANAAAQTAPKTYSPPKMRLLADSSPVPPPADAEPVGYERAFTLNLNPQQGSSVLGPRSPAAAPVRAPAPEPAATKWRADSAGYSAPMAAPAASGNGPIVSIEPLPLAPAPVLAQAASASAALRPAAWTRQPTPLSLAPLAILDRLFDAIVAPLGAIGEWLKGPAGKNLIGYTGLAMIGGSAAWGLLDWFGWTR